MVHAIEGRLPTYRQMVDEFFMKMAHSSERLSSDRRRRLETLSGRLEALSPLKVLGRGYTLVQEPATGRLVKSVQDVKPGQDVALLFHDGKANARIT